MLDALVSIIKDSITNSVKATYLFDRINYLKVSDRNFPF